MTAVVSVWIEIPIVKTAGLAGMSAPLGRSAQVGLVWFLAPVAKPSVLVGVLISKAATRIVVLVEIAADLDAFVLEELASAQWDKPSVRAFALIPKATAVTVGLVE